MYHFSSSTFWEDSLQWDSCHGNVNIHLQLLLKSWKWSFCDPGTHPFTSILPRPQVTFSLFASWHRDIPWSRTMLPRSLRTSLSTSLVLSFWDSQMHTLCGDSSTFSFSFLPAFPPPTCLFPLPLPPFLSSSTCWYLPLLIQFRYYPGLQDLGLLLLSPSWSSLSYLHIQSLWRTQLKV